jgi:2-oxoglutarate ferredoxin oxidoreductase subunit beta
MNTAHLDIVHTDPALLSKKDFVPDNEVRWCPGCADYSILAQVQKTLPTLGIPKENFVFVSGIGCSSRFPYYMDTYGIHGIHGRAPAIATGLKVARPELSVWMITGDGDALAIGGNHFIHALRRNVGLKVLLFNNRIYGLTKGQYSPTSEMGKKTKSTPLGSIDYPLEPVSVALGVGTTFIARVLGTDAQMMGQVLDRAAKHKGTAFIEIYQSCTIFNDGAFDYLSDAKTKEDHRLVLRHGQPLVFGTGGSKGIGLDANGHPTVIDVARDGMAGVLTYDETSDTLPFVLSRLGAPAFPTPLGVFRSIEHDTYEDLVVNQINTARSRKSGNAQSLLEEGECWTVE